MKAKTLSLLFLAASLVVFFFALIFHVWNTPKNNKIDIKTRKAPASEISTESSRLSSNDKKISSQTITRVNPLFGIDDMVKGFIATASKDMDTEIDLLEFKSKMESYKKSGKTLWGSEKWMKSKETYQKMTTIELARECFSDGTYYVEMGKYDDPRYGMLTLRIMHNGLSELIQRDNLWEGVLDCYSNVDKEIKYGLDGDAIYRKCETLYELLRLYQCCPEMKEQLKGRERIFIEAQVRCLDAFVQYIEDTKQFDHNKVLKFYREPIVIARTALMLLQTDDSQAYQRIVSSLRTHTLSRNQDQIELQNYLKEVIALFKREYLKRG